MYELITVILPVATAILLSWGLARLGRKRKIGFLWSFYFGILNPLIALWMILFSRKKEAVRRKISIVWKPIAFFLLLDGILLVYSSFRFSTQETIDQNLMENQVTAQHKINTGDAERDLILNDSAANFGKMFGGGVISIFVKNTSRTNPYYKFYVGLVLISIGTFIFTREIEKASDLRKPKVAPQTRNLGFQEEATFQEKVNPEIMTINQGTKRFNLKERILGNSSRMVNFRSFICSIVAGFFLGWIYKVPNNSLMEALMEYPSQWKMEMALDYCRKKSSFFSTELFDFNWGLFFISTIVIFFVLKILQDGEFRRRILKDFEFKN